MQFSSVFRCNVLYGVVNVLVVLQDRYLSAAMLRVLQYILNVTEVLTRDLVLVCHGGVFLYSDFDHRTCLKMTGKSQSM
jgi:hypothetical protein